MRPTLITAAAAGLAALSILSGPAWAQANRTFVSGFGSDANLCTLSAPCRSFAQAITQTNAGGEITILDPAGYGPLTITKTISIINDGVGEAGVTTSAVGDAITITAGVSDVVTLRGLNLVGGGVGTTGVKINSAGTVNIQNSVIRGFAGNGIYMASTGSGILNVTDTTASNNAFTGTYVQPIGNVSVHALFKRVQVFDNGTRGIDLDGRMLSGTGSMKGIAIDTVSSGNFDAGFQIRNNPPPVAIGSLELINCQSYNNLTSGVATLTSNAYVFLAQTTISENSSGYDIEGGGIMYSFGNNHLAPNNTNFGTLTPMPQQ